MQIVITLITIVQLLCGLAVVLAVLFQSGKEKGLSGSIVGGAESFGGKSKKAKRDALLNRLTTILSITFAVIAVALYIYVTTKITK